jgi:endonuclease-3
MMEFKCKKRLCAVKNKKKRAELVMKTLASLYPDAVCSLEYGHDPFRLLVMSRLSAQCTDKRVNEVSVELFRRLPDAHAFANAEISEIESLIKSCGLYHMKAKNLKEMSQQLIDFHNGEVPRTKEELLKLSGIGVKIANLMMGDVFGDPHIVPDTHCIRIAHRTRLTSKPDPAVCLRELTPLIPKAEQSDFCHRIVLFGRDICTAQSPKCHLCPLAKE